MNWMKMIELWNEFCKENGIGKCVALMPTDIESFLIFCNNRQAQMMKEINDAEE